MWIVASQSYGGVENLRHVCFKLVLHLAADLEPPKPRPKTSARTAQRLIAHGMGMGLKQFTNFGSDELKKQEEERKSRSAARQAKRDEAWGSD